VEPRSRARRAFLLGAARTLGVAAGLAAGGGLGELARLGALGRPGGGERGVGFRPLATALWDSLSPAQRAAIVLPWEHPSRELVGHVACLDTPRLASVLDAPQRELVHRLYETIIAPERLRRFGRLVGLEGGGLDPCNIALYGDPRTERCQLTFSGGHLLVRGGGTTDAGSALGGPIAYGHQIGDGVPRLPGNAFAYHGDAANALFERLASAERTRSLVPGEPPFETAVQLQGADGRFQGLPARALGEGRRADLESLVSTVLSCYDEADREAAWRCIRGNGGVEALHLAFWTSRGFYDDGAAWDALTAEERVRRGNPYWHVWRIEGPGTLIHFRGWSHVHAAIHVAEDGGARQHVGEVLAESDRLLDGEPLRALLRDALREASGEALAFYPSAIPARVPRGPFTTGLAWAFDPYRDELVVAVVPGRGASAPLREALAAQGETPRDDRPYRVAMPAYAATVAEWIGEPEDVQPTGVPLRAAYERYFRAFGLSRLG
jgi:hypothetical protein